MVTIEAFGHAATFDQGRWTSSDRRLEAYLNIRLAQLDHSPARGRFDVYAAEEAVAAIGGDAKIVSTSREHVAKDTVA